MVEMSEEMENHIIRQLYGDDVDVSDYYVDMSGLRSRQEVSITDIRDRITTTLTDVSINSSGELLMTSGEKPGLFITMVEFVQLLGEFERAWQYHTRHSVEDFIHLKLYDDGSGALFHQHTVVHDFDDVDGLVEYMRDRIREGGF
jgi:hypothetical protein